MSVAQANSGFIAHCELAFTENPEQYKKNYQKNWGETIGQGLLWHVTELPRHINRALNNPKVLTVAFTAAALFAVQLTFYPAATISAAKIALGYVVPYISASAVKAASYVLIQTAILGWGTRALGRFSNEELMNGFYGVQQNG